MDFSYNNSALWAVIFIVIGALKIIFSIIDLIKGGHYKKTRSFVLDIILGIVIVMCGVLPLLGIGSFVPAD